MAQPGPAEIERALTDCAALIEAGHEKLLPWFEVLEELLVEANARVDALARVKLRLSGKAVPSATPSLTASPRP